MLPLRECTARSSLMSLVDIKLIAIVNWICHVSDIFGLFVAYVKYDLITSTYCLIDSPLFISPLRFITIKITDPYWFVISLSSHKRVLISLIILFLIASFSFFGLKRFLTLLILLFSIVLSLVVLFFVLGKLIVF